MRTTCHWGRAAPHRFNIAASAGGRAHQLRPCQWSLRMRRRTAVATPSTGLRRASSLRRGRWGALSAKVSMKTGPSDDKSATMAMATYSQSLRPT